MERRSLGAGLMVLASSFLLLVGTASAHPGAAKTAAGAGSATSCTIKSLPSFVAQGEFGTFATAADVIEVGCDPVAYGTDSKVKITASQLYSFCHEIKWYVPNPYNVSYGSGVELNLDADGNATVALIAGPRCSAGTSLITLHELNEPFESIATSFQVTPPEETAQGVTALPSSQIEDSESSAVATILEAEFKEGSEKYVRFGSEELYARCRNSPHLHLIEEDGDEYIGSEITEQQLDNDGNVFVLAIGDSSCFPGKSLIEADLESKPFTTETTEFTIEAPKPRF